MKHLIVLLLLCLSVFCVHSQTKYSKAKVYFEGKPLSDLAQLGVETDHGVLKRGVFFISNFSEDEIRIISEAGFNVEIMVDDAIEDFHQRNEFSIQRGAPLNCNSKNPIDLITTPENFELGSMGGFLTLEEMLDELDKMRELYPHLISIKEPIANIKTHDGNDIWWVRVSDHPDAAETNEPEILYTALHHAREPASLSQMIFFMWHILENYESDVAIKEMIDHSALCFIPCVNPDGYLYNESKHPQGGGLWRKNRCLNHDGTYGVDLNRNYAFEWAFDDVGSSPSTTAETYRGNEPFSEPETRSVKHFIREHNFKITLNYHAFGNYLIYPWAYQDEQPADSALYRNVAENLTKENNFKFGTSHQTLEYVTNGSSDDWMYGGATVPSNILAFTPEVGTDFWPMSSEIEEICKNTLHQNIRAARFLHGYIDVQELSNSYVLNKDDNISYEFQWIGTESEIVEIATTPLGARTASTTQHIQRVLNPFERFKIDFPLDLYSTVKTGDEIVFEVKMRYKQFEETHYFTHIYYPENQVFHYPQYHPSQWEMSNGSSWGNTSEHYVSFPKAFADSPWRPYNNNIDQTFTLIDTFDLISSQEAYLSFWAKWDIERQFDFAQIRISKDGSDFMPVCGKYAEMTGHLNAPSNEPFYHGEKSAWVKEEIDLTDFVGHQIRIQFRLKTDEEITADGFYFDDLTVVSVPSQPTVPEQHEPTHWWISPNPAKASTTFRLIEPMQFQYDMGSFTLLSPHGKRLITQSIHPNGDSFVIKMNDIPSGLYYYCVQFGADKTTIGKIVVQR